MKLRKSVLVGAISCCVTGTMSGIAEAGDRARQSIFVFDKDVAVPGKVLPAGKYVFRLADSPANRHVVQILDQNGRVVTTVLTIPTPRRVAFDETRITFDWSAGDSPVSITRWFHPGELEGEEFVYPAQPAKWSGDE